MSPHSYTVRADICTPDDTAAVGRFREALGRLGAIRHAKDWVPDCDIYRLKIGADEVTVFCDQSSIDIEGPEHLVRNVLKEYQRTDL